MQNETTKKEQMHTKLTGLYIKPVQREGYADHTDYEIHASPIMGTYANGEPCEFKPHLADVTFGRSNKEKKKNAELICRAVNSHDNLIQTIERNIRTLEAWDRASRNGTYKNIIADLQTALDKARQ